MRTDRSVTTYNEDIAPAVDLPADPIWAMLMLLGHLAYGPDHPSDWYISGDPWYVVVNERTDAATEMRLTFPEGTHFNLALSPRSSMVFFRGTVAGYIGFDRTRLIPPATTEVPRWLVDEVGRRRVEAKAAPVDQFVGKRVCEQCGVPLGEFAGDSERVCEQCLTIGIARINRG